VTRADHLKLAVVAHDLRTPLGAIAMKARHLIEVLLPDDAAHRRARDEVDGIVQSARMMERLVHDLLDATSIQAGMFSIARDDHDVLDIFADMEDAMSASAASKNITMKWSPAIEMQRISCDRDRVLQVLSNLTGNALKFTPPGGRIEVSGRDVGDFHTFCVSDTGAGIPPEILDRVFEPFVHGASRGEGAAGLGLGLFIARAIVGAHGGRIWIVRTGPSGTTMCFSLPK
jgi:signal transduction histidine kinase